MSSLTTANRSQHHHHHINNNNNTMRLMQAWLVLISAIVASGQSPIDQVNVQEIKEDFVKKDAIVDISVACQSENMNITLKTSSDTFNGLVYPKGLSKNSTCMTEYRQVDGTRVVFVVPLRSCNTMSVDVADGVEYFNTIVVQPHRKLVTNQGKGYHVRCRYRTEETTLRSDFNVSALATTHLTATAAMPAAAMKIYAGEPVDGQLAEAVKIGDPLTMVVGIDQQDIYGMHITDCLVRDGLGWSQQNLINQHGCPEDNEIMGEFEYSSTKTTALVRFQAHKFPHTASVYYQCNIRLCIRHAGGCDDVPPVCQATGRLGLSKPRLKRQLVEQDETRGQLYDTDREDLKVKVYSGLYVNDATDLDDRHLDDGADGDIPTTKVDDPNTVCIPQRDFAIGIAIAGLMLILAVIAIILVVLTRRRRRKDLSTTTGSSLYSGPYTNTAYSSHSS